MINTIQCDIKFDIEGPKKDESEKDISAITLIGDYILVGSDEGNYLQLLKKQHALHYRQVDKIILDKNTEEIDIEGITRQGETIYVICSCALVRKSLKAKKKIKENIDRLQTISSEQDRSSRCQLFKFTFDPDSGNASDIEVIDLKDILLKDQILGRFMNIPSKENGVDIEGIAVDNETLYLGFRGPVLRGNYVPIMVTTFDHPESYKLLYVQMDGRGVRDITKVRDGFLIVGGPVGDGEGAYNLYFWDGTNSIPGKDQEIDAQMVNLGTIPTKGAKAEGITVINETETDYEVLIVYDTLAHGGPELFQIRKP